MWCLTTQELYYAPLSVVVGQNDIWDTLPSFRMWPKKTFFGLDQNNSHCFTLPKAVNEQFIQHFALGERRLQREITFLINNDEYLAKIRLVRMDRRRPRVLQEGDLPQREVLQFQWKSFEDTQFEIREQLQVAYDSIVSGNNDRQCVIFHHAGSSAFIIQSI